VVVVVVVVVVLLLLLVPLLLLLVLLLPLLVLLLLLLPLLLPLLELLPLLLLEQLAKVHFDTQRRMRKMSSRRMDSTKISSRTQGSDLKKGVRMKTYVAR